MEKLVTHIRKASINAKDAVWSGIQMMEHCNICSIDVEDVDAHIRTPKHLENLDKIKNMFKSKVYRDDKSVIDI